MKIIQKGKLPPPIIFTGTCPYCRAVVECDASEASCEGDRHAHHGEARYYIKCPTEGCLREDGITLERKREEEPVTGYNPD